MTYKKHSTNGGPKPLTGFEWIWIQLNAPDKEKVKAALGCRSHTTALKKVRNPSSLQIKEVEQVLPVLSAAFPGVVINQAFLTKNCS